MNTQAISNEEFLALYNGAKKTNPTPLTISLSALILSGEGYEKGYVDIVFPTTGKTRMYVTKTFFKQLAKMMKFNIKISSTMESEDFGELLNALKTLQSTHLNNTEVTVVFDPVEKKLTHIGIGSYNRISNSQLFDFANALVDSNSNLRIVQIIGGDQSSNQEIRILSSEQIGLANVVSDDPEEFQFGITLANRGISTIIGDFAYRLVCSNGMMGIRTDDRFMLGGTDRDNLHSLFTHFDKIRAHKFIPEDFNENVSTASQVPASFDELQIAFNTIVNGIVPEFPEQKQAIIDALKHKYFEELIAVEKKLKLKNINEVNLSKKQKQLIRTDKNMWELINILTDLGSNQTIYPLNNKHYLQRIGGKMLASPFDLKDIHLLYL